MQHPQRQQHPKKPEPAQTRTYYEAWGDSLNTLNTYKLLVVTLAFSVFALLILLKLESSKLPLVIKVDSLGAPQVVRDWKSRNYISPPEIHHFVKTFMEHFHGYDVHTYRETFNRAFDMMTPKLQQRMNADFQARNVVQQIEQDELKASYRLVKVDVTKDAQNALYVKVRGYRDLGSYANRQFKRTTFFDAELVLTKVDRTEKTPWGLLVDAYTETVFKDE
jgi:type IV secretory pathway TrbF-like protein